MDDRKQGKTISNSKVGLKMLIKKSIVGALALLQLSVISANIEINKGVETYYVQGIEIDTDCTDMDCSIKMLESINQFDFEERYPIEGLDSIKRVQYLPTIEVISGRNVKLQMTSSESTLLLCTDADGNVLDETCIEPVESSWTYWLSIDDSESGDLSINPKNIPFTCTNSRYKTCEDFVVRKDSVELEEYWIAGHHVLGARNVIALFRVGLMR